MMRHRGSMKVFDPLVSVEPSNVQLGLRGWAVAAAIIARLNEASHYEGIDVTALIGPVISDLSDSELEELARQISGTLMDIPRCLPAEQFRVASFLKALPDRPR